MKTFIAKVSFCTLLTGFALCSSGWAFPTDLVGKSVKVSNGLYGTTAGGEFNLDIGKDESVDYVSFCLERDEYINYKDTFYIGSVQDEVTNGGVNINGIGFDEVSFETEWIVYTYFFGTFTDKSGTATTVSSDVLANYVQYMIWVLEGEMKYNAIYWDSARTISGSSVEAFYNTYVAGFASNTYDDYVTILNLVDDDENPAQSQIIAERMPDPVPEPATMFLFGTGLIGLAGLTRRRMQR